MKAQENIKRAEKRAEKVAERAEKAEIKLAKAIEKSGGDPEDPNVRKAEDDVLAAAQAAEDQLEKEIQWAHRFYTVETNRSGDPKICFSITSILDILKELGFYRYDSEESGGKSVYVRIKDGRIKQLRDTKEVRDAFVAYIRDLLDYNAPIKGREEKYYITPNMLLEKLLSSVSYYLGEDKLERLLPDEEITIMHDTQSAKYMYYRNCVLRISSSGVEKINYDNLSAAMEAFENVTGEKNGRYIWENNIIDRDFRGKIEINNGVIKDTGGDFEDFCKMICGYGGTIKSESDSQRCYQRYLSLMSILGYLMHGNYECNLKAVLFMDVNMQGGNRANGGSGKGIIGKALSAVMNKRETDCKYISEGGKNFHTDDERRYSNGDLSTQLIHIEDIVENFNFKGFYNDITEYIPIRKMNVDKVMIRSKIMLSSNTPIDVITAGGSNKRRLVVFELDNYFNSRYTPEDKYGKRFFESKWTDYDWATFDLFMVKCSFVYMSYKDQYDTSKIDAKHPEGVKFGILEPPMINYKRQLLEAKYQTCPEFLGWWEDKIAPYVAGDGKHTELKKKELFIEFGVKYPAYENAQKYARAFCKWCKFYLEVMEIESVEKRSTDDLIILYPYKSDGGDVIYSKED